MNSVLKDLKTVGLDPSIRRLRAEIFSQEEFQEDLTDIYKKERKYEALFNVLKKKLFDCEVVFLKVKLLH